MCLWQQHNELRQLFLIFFSFVFGMEKNVVQSLVNMRNDRVTFRKNDGRSDVWSSFVKVEVDAWFSGYVMCIKCSTVLKWKSSDGTSGLRTHKTTCKAGNEKISETVDLLVPATNFKKSINSKNEINVATLEKDALADEIVRMCAKDLIPFDVVEREGFQELVSRLITFGALYGPMDAQTILPNEIMVSRHAQLLAEEERRKLTVSLLAIAKFSVTIDVWSHKRSFETFLTIKVHYIDEEWNLCSVTLATRTVNQHHPPNAIRSIVTEVLQSFSAHRYDNTFITDNDANLKSAFKDSTWISCCSHNINLIITEGLNIDTNSPLQCVTSLISTCYDIVEHATKSQALRRLDMPLKKAVMIQWSSILEMLKSIDINIVHLKNTATELEDKKLEKLLTNLNETLLQDVIKVLEVFQQACRLLSSDNSPTVHLVVATKCKLIKSTQPSPSDSDVIITLKKKLLELIKYYFLIHRICYIALLLDPRLKNNKTVWTNEDKDSAIQQLRDLLKVKVEIQVKEEYSAKNDFESSKSCFDSSFESTSKRSKVDFLDEIFMEAKKPMTDEVCDLIALLILYKVTWLFVPDVTGR